MSFVQTDSVVPAGVSVTLTVQPPNDLEKPSINAVNKDGTVMVKTWMGDANGNLIFPEVDDPEFMLPALSSDKAPLAICISGGGVRAATLALGWLRGLHKVGVLQKAKYLVTCSGSSWTGSALCFQKVAELDDFLGKYLEPEECTLEALGQVGSQDRSFASAVSDATPLKTYMREVLCAAVSLLNTSVKPDDGTTARAWTKAMAKSFLEPFGLGKTDKSTVTCVGTKGAVHTKIAERAAEAGRGEAVYEADVQKLPYLIICQDVLWRNDPSNVKFYPFEWTPLYAGCPVSYSNTTPKLGCGWVETLGLNAALEDPPVVECPATDSAVPTDQQPLQLRVRPAGPASLAEATGISSAYGSLEYQPFPGTTPLGQTIYNTLGFHTATYFNTQDWSNSTISLTDGGGTDLHAVYPALRRKVANVMVLSATETAILDYDSFVKNRKEICLMFGCWPGAQEPSTAPADVPEARGGGSNLALPADKLNEMFKVFPTEGFAELYAALKAKVEAGQPAVHVATYPVLANSFLGIPGGWHVRVMWVINDRQAAWEERLPQDTRDKLEEERANPVLKKLAETNKYETFSFCDFPLVSTFVMDYPPELVGLMSAHAAHMLVANRDAVNQMLDPVVVHE